MAACLVGGAVQKVELVIGKAVPTQSCEKLPEEALRLRMRRIEQVIALAQAGINQRGTVFAFEQPVGVSAGQLRIGCDVKRRQPDARFKAVAVDSRRQRPQAPAEKV